MFNKNIKDASEYTKRFNQNVLKKLDFENKKDFDDVQKGFIDTDKPLSIKNKDGRIIWDMVQYDFLEKTDDFPDSANPSLWRQAKLNYYNGLFKVTDRIYQIREYDISNMTIIEGDTGLIVIDPLVSTETAKAGIELYFKNRPKKLIKTIIYTHSHIDHYGGIKGVISQEQVDNGEVQIIAPEGFASEAISENLFAGTAMFRRGIYDYGAKLPKNSQGGIDVGIGKTASEGTSSIILPTKLIGKSGTKLNVDGIEIIFQMAKGTEAPTEFIMYYPQFKVLDIVEIVTHNIHNVYTLRGAKVRDARKWWKAIDAAIASFADEAEIMIAQHHWPTWDNEKINDMLIKQRDAYKFLHDQSLRLANQGFNGCEIGEKMKLPKSLEKEWHLRDYYGSFNHNAKAIYQFYLGWFDGNPANLYNLPPEEVAKRYVDLAGGVEEAIKKGKEAYDKGDYRWVAELMKHVVFTDPNNDQARYLEADALEQLGYQTENGAWRNFLLTGADELRNGSIPVGLDNSDSLLQMPTELLLDYMGLLVDKEKAEGKNISVNLKLTDRGDKGHLRLDNSVLIYRIDDMLDNPDINLSIDVQTLIGLAYDKINVNDIIKDDLKINGDKEKFKELINSLASFGKPFNLTTP